MYNCEMMYTFEEKIYTLGNYVYNFELVYTFRINVH